MPFGVSSKERAPEKTIVGEKDRYFGWTRGVFIRLQ